MKENKELDLAYQFVRYTNKNIFLTGKAGTGKTTFLKSLKNTLFKRMIVTAPTGVAAINAHGVTLHSFFQLPFGPILTEKVAGRKINNPNFRQKFNKSKINIIRTLDLLIIDEISMVRADILDAIDEILRRYKNPNKPFGGIQLLMIGDLQQLAPIVKREDTELLSPYYSSMFFFNSKALQESNFITIELKHIYRQKENSFLEILNEIRNDRLSQESYDLLHERFKTNFSPKDHEGYITLTTHNANADQINKKKLQSIDDQKYSFAASIEGNFPDHSYPTDFDLKLKPGAQVMFVKNDSSGEKRYFNGKIGTVVGIEEDEVIVKCEGDNEEIITGQERWENIRYAINKETKDIEEEFIGAFVQYPLRLAWAVTIHKSQGLTFDKAIIDAAGAFAHGQTYVALSRCRTLKGLVLSSRIEKSAIICDPEINKFTKQSEKSQPDEEGLKKAIYDYQLELINDLFDYRQLSYRVDKIEKALRLHHGSYTGNIGETIYELQHKSLVEIKKISGNFLKQIRTLSEENPDAEKNEALQNRLKKASEYFIQYHDEHFMIKLHSSSFESDNIAVKKEVEERIESFFEIINIKQISHKSCLSGFKMKDYLNERAKAMLEEKGKKRKANISFKETDTIHPDLYTKLKTWRKGEAEKTEIQLYMIASNKTLQAISNEMPSSLHSLKTIPGIGNKKIEQYGNALITVVTEYLISKGIKPEENEPEPIKQPKRKNWEISYEMFKEGKSIDEIAKAQGFVNQTIENHLGRYIISGDIKIEELVSKDIVKTISDYLNKNPDTFLKKVKEDLNDEFSYSQIKFVQKHMMSINKTKL